MGGGLWRKLAVFGIGAGAAARGVEYALCRGAIKPSVIYFPHRIHGLFLCEKYLKFDALGITTSSNGSR